MNKPLENFLIELTELCNKYKMDIYGCGCCGSPTVHQKLGSANLFHDNLNPVFKEEKELIGYEIEEETINIF